MPHIGVTSCLFVVRYFYLCTIMVRISDKSPVFSPVFGSQCRSGQARGPKPPTRRWLLLLLPLLPRLAPAKMLNCVLEPVTESLTEEPKHGQAFAR
jgi:hypothetical protein